MSYQAYILAPYSVGYLITRYIPKFSVVRCHHVTYRFGVSKDSPLPPYPNGVWVVGYSCNDHIECFVVSVGGITVRPDGGTFHITHSHTHGHKPYESNALLAEKGYIDIEPIRVFTTPAVCR